MRLNFYFLLFCISHIFYSKNVFAGSKWLEVPLSYIECRQITSEIEKYQLKYSTHPEVLSLVDIVEADCEGKDDPVTVASDDFPLTVKGTRLLFTWSDRKTVNITIADLPPERAQHFITLSGQTQIGQLSGPELEKTKQAHQNWWSAIKSRAAQISQKGETRIIIPLLAWHDRATYSPENLNELNEKPFGVGVARDVINEFGNKERVFALVHLDSHGDVEIDVGYAWQKQFHVANQIKAGIGYSFGLISRKDIEGRAPIPYLLPMASLEIGKNTALEAVLIPKLDGGINHGNVLFVFVTTKWKQ